jgi:hypothetical protein
MKQFEQTQNFTSSYWWRHGYASSRCLNLNERSSCSSSHKSKIRLQNLISVSNYFKFTGLRVRANSQIYLAYMRLRAGNTVSRAWDKWNVTSDNKGVHVEECHRSVSPSLLSHTIKTSAEPRPASPTSFIGRSTHWRPSKAFPRKNFLKKVLCSLS